MELLWLAVKLGFGSREEQCNTTMECGHGSTWQQTYNLSSSHFFILSFWAIELRTILRVQLWVFGDFSEHWISEFGVFCF